MEVHWMMSHFKQYINDFFCLLFPDLCNACGAQLFQGEQQICTRCLHDLPYTDFHLYAENPVAKLFWGRIYCHNAMAMLYFRKGTRVQELIHQLKYRSQTALGYRMGVMLAERLARSADYSDADLIIPVPLHFKKERRRGYNQTELIAKGMARLLQIPVSTTLLIRVLDTGTQTKRNRYNRFENMKAVFYSPMPGELAGKNIILVDDVITTGATLEACGQILLDCGVSKLSVAAVAFAE
jgi:ComF family protein